MLLLLLLLLLNPKKTVPKPQNLSAPSYPLNCTPGRPSSAGPSKKLKNRTAGIDAASLETYRTTLGPQAR